MINVAGPDEVEVGVAGVRNQEGRSTREHAEKSHSKREDIGGTAIKVLAGEQLWRHVSDLARLFLGNGWEDAVFGDAAGYTKVAELEIALVIEEEVLKRKVQVSILLAVNELKSRDHLHEVVVCRAVIEVATLTDEVEELASRAVLHDKPVNIVLKVFSKDLDNIGVAALKLAHHKGFVGRILADASSTGGLALFKKASIRALDGNYLRGGLIVGEQHIAKQGLAKNANDLEPMTGRGRVLSSSGQRSHGRTLLGDHQGR